MGVMINDSWKKEERDRNEWVLGLYGGVGGYSMKRWLFNAQRTLDRFFGVFITTASIHTLFNILRVTWKL